MFPNETCQEKQSGFLKEQKLQARKMLKMVLANDKAGKLIQYDSVEKKELSVKGSTF